MTNSSFYPVGTVGQPWGVIETGYEKITYGRLDYSGERRCKRPWNLPSLIPDPPPRIDPFADVRI